jgi:predicted membrane metal-binding protein
MDSREALESELSSALREANRRAQELRDFCDQNGLMLAAVVSEKVGDNDDLEVATQITGQTNLLAASISYLAQRLFAISGAKMEP